MQRRSHLIHALLLSLGISGAIAAQDSSDLEISYKNALLFNNSDGSVQLKIGGRLHNQWTFWDYDDALGPTGADMAPVDGVYFRRARLYFSGKLYDSVGFKAQYDFAGGTVGFKDAYIQLEIPAFGKYRVGQMYEPFGLETMTSSNNITFVERSSGAGSISPDRNTGMLLTDSWASGNGTWSFGWFRGDSDGAGDAEGDVDGSWTGRVTWLPLFEDDGARLIHLGIASSIRHVKDGEARFAARPSARPSEKLVDTGLILDVDSVSLVGFEAAWVEGPLSLQTEYMVASPEVAGGEELNFSHWYVEGSYVLTGEHRSYKKSSGVFGGVRPKTIWGSDEGKGALQAAVRISSTDFEDGTVNGGAMDQVALGFNWILNPACRVMIDHVRATSEPVGQTAIDADSQALTMRFQITF
ncbi:MAG TPA: hypothetical protein EYN79_08400 [Planctomycetes bacterium]|nr:hypothetical protein [Planctomycetota bacterium]